MAKTFPLSPFKPEAVEGGLAAVRASVVDQRLRRHGEDNFFEDYARYVRGAALLHSTKKQMQEFEDHYAEEYIADRLTEPRRRWFDTEVFSWQSVIKRMTKRIKFKGGL